MKYTFYFKGGNKNGISNLNRNYIFIPGMAVRRKIKSARTIWQIFWLEGISFMNDTKKKIIEGIKLLNKECKQISQDKCHSMWDMKMLEGEGL